MATSRDWPRRDQSRPALAADADPACDRWTRGGAAATLRSEARTFLQEHPGRTGSKVDAPLRLLAALHGAWSGEDPANYAIVDTGLTTKARFLRNGRLQQTDHTAPTTRVLVQTLAEREHRVLAFLPGDRHAPFSYARTLTGLPAEETTLPRADIDALLLLTDAEFGGASRAGEQLSELHSALQKRIAIHTSPMLPHEQRASEIAFERGVAVVMFATGTLAQGLNLPATAVVIGGTSVGDRRFRNTPEDAPGRVLSSQCDRACRTRANRRPVDLDRSP